MTSATVAKELLQRMVRHWLKRLPFVSRNRGMPVRQKFKFLVISNLRENLNGISRQINRAAVGMTMDMRPNKELMESQPSLLNIVAWKSSCVPKRKLVLIFGSDH